MYMLHNLEAPDPLGSYSQGASAARFAFVSAQLPQDPQTGKLIDASLGMMTVLSLKYVEAVLSDAGLTLQDVCSLTIYLTDLSQARIVDEVLAERLPKPYAARTLVGASELPLGSPIQISAIACH